MVLTFNARIIAGFLFHTLKYCSIIIHGHEKSGCFFQAFIFHQYNKMFFAYLKLESLNT